MILYSILSLFVLFLCEAFLVFHIEQKNNTTITFSQNKDLASIPDDSLSIKITSFHNCEDPAHAKTASFFELKIINTTDSDFKNWELTIPLANDLQLNKVINANVEKKEKTLIFTSKNKASNIIKANSINFIELFVSHTSPIDYNTLYIKGNLIRKISTCPLHIIIIVLSSIIIVALVIYIIVYSYMKREIDVLNRVTKRSNTIIDQTMKTFVNFIDAKDKYTRGHSSRVAEYSMAIAKRMGYDDQFQQDMYYMGLMHDIGKITVPDTILNKTSHLTADEWAVIQLHTQNGANLLRNFTIIPEIRDAVLYHHERYDGKGYLEQLKGEEIPLCARIICVADSYDAMNTNRCYRLKYSKERIIKEFERCSARQFDPTIASIMIELISDGTI